MTFHYLLFSLYIIYQQNNYFQKPIYNMVTQTSKKVYCITYGIIDDTYIYLIIPISFFSLKNSNKFIKNQKEIQENQKKKQKIRKSIRGRKYSILQTIGEKKYSRLEIILLEVIERRKYSKLQTVRGKKYNGLHTILLTIHTADKSILEKGNIVHYRQY